MHVQPATAPSENAEESPSVAFETQIALARSHPVPTYSSRSLVDIDNGMYVGYEVCHPADYGAALETLC